MARGKNEEKSFLKDVELETLVKIKKYKENCEKNLVSILWNDTNEYHYNDSLKAEDFSSSNYRTLFEIGYGIVVKENKTINDMVIDEYLYKHNELKVKYDNFSGRDILLSKSEVDSKNISSYIRELEKWKVVMEMAKAKFPVSHRLKDFVDMTVEDIYNENEALLNHIFSGIDGEDVTYKLSHNIDQLIDDLDEGLAIGLPFNSAPLLNHETGGQSLGNITLVGGLSGMGKTSVSRIWLLPSCIENNEKLVIMINEEGLAKWQREMLIWVANNIYKEDTQKYKLRDGNYSKEFKAFLKEKCAKWIKDNDENIILRPFKKYTTAKAIKCIKTYSHIGCKYFMLDTFKADSGVSNESLWLSLQQNMVDIYDEVKPENKNLHILITFQLSKSSSKIRYYTQDNIGMAKNMIDVASTCIMIRNVFEDEYEGEKNELKVYKMKGKTKIPVSLDKNRYYMVIFIVKNREGSSNNYQIVAEVDLSRNIFKEIGLTSVNPDF